MIYAPCKDCKDRFLGCHSKCDKYKDYKKRSEELNDMKNKSENISMRGYINDMSIRRKKK